MSPLKCAQNDYQSWNMALQSASTGLTLSKEQLAEATARVKAAGLEDKITFLYCDYRDCKGRYTGKQVLSGNTSTTSARGLLMLPLHTEPEH
jgi:hypothetical protein